MSIKVVKIVKVRIEFLVASPNIIKIDIISIFNILNNVIIIGFSVVKFSLYVVYEIFSVVTFKIVNRYVLFNRIICGISSSPI